VGRTGRAAGQDPRTIKSQKRLIADTFLAPLQVVLIDPDPPDYRSLQNAFRRRARRWQLHCFPDPKEALEKAPHLHSDALLISTELPGVTGLDCARMLKAILPRVAVIFLARSLTLETLLWYHQLPAEGYLVRPLTTPALIEAVARAVRGLHTICQEAADIYEREVIARSRDASRALLSERERQIMEHVAAGLQNKEIGALLGISATTVHAHRTHIYHKLGARGEKDATRKYLALAKNLPSPGH
jgi:DNA-binding NarL/FixJ family response regulator